MGKVFCYCRNCRISDVSPANQQHRAVAKAIRNGSLPRLDEAVCVDCAAKATVYDHRDYEKPLEVVPVCVRCNLRRGPGKNRPERLPCLGFISAQMYFSR